MLSEAGIHDYAIFLDAETLTLFAFQRLEDDFDDAQLPAHPIVKKWWAYIRVKDKSLLASKTVLEVLKKSNKNDVGAYIEYTDNEKKLIQFLDKNEKITLKQYCKLVNISHWRARKILVNLVRAEVIRIHTTEKTSFYTLA